MGCLSLRGQCSINRGVQKYRYRLKFLLFLVKYSFVSKIQVSVLVSVKFQVLVSVLVELKFLVVVSVSVGFLGIGTTLVSQ